ncbi:MAG: hypothetical protein QXV51_03240 [Thermosphaera sp.]
MKNISLVLLFIFAIGSSAGFFESESTIRSTHRLSLLAIDNDGRGKTIDVFITIYSPGRGAITVVPSNAFAQDTIISFKLALLYSSLLTGEDYRKYDYTISVHGITQVEGTSASLLFLLFSISLFKNESIDSLKSATGIIGPGGVVGRVGGIPQKTEAARLSGLKLVIGPSTAEINDEIYRPVLTVFQAYEIYSNNAFLPDVKYGEMFSPVLNDFFKEIWNYFYGKTSETISYLNDTQWDDSFLNNALRLLNDSTKYAEINHYYTASSIAFQAYFYAYSSLLNYSYYNSPVDFSNLILKLKENVSQARIEFENTTSFLTCVNPFMIDAIANAYKRLEEAEASLVLAESSSGLTEKIGNYSYSIARAETSITWLRLAALYGGKYCLSNSSLVSALWWMRELVSTSISYYSVMSYLTGISIPSPTGNPLLDLIYLFGLLEELSNQLYANPLLIRNQIFPVVNDTIVEDFMIESLKAVSVYTMNKLGMPIPSLITMIEFLNDASNLSNNIESIIIQLLTSHGNAIAYLVFTMQHTQKSTLEYLYDPSLVPQLLLPVLVFLSLAGFLLVISGLERVKLIPASP